MTPPIPKKALKLSEMYEGRVGKQANGLYMPVQLPADRKGVLTVGIGHVMTERELESGLVMINGHPSNWKDGLTDQEVDALFISDKQNRWNRVVELMPGATPDQLAGGLFFYFNTPSGLVKGTPGRAFRAGDRAKCAAGFLLYTKSDGEHRLGLFRRQMSCADLFMTGSISKPDTEPEDAAIYKKLNDIGIIEKAKAMNAAQGLGIPFFAYGDKLLKKYY